MISSSFEGMPLSISAVSLEANIEPQSTSSTGWPKHFEHCDSQLPRVCSSVMLVSPLFLSFQRFRLPRGGEAVRLRGAFLSRVWLCPWRGARGLIVQMFYACRNKCADHASVHEHPIFFFGCSCQCIRYSRRRFLWRWKKGWILFPRHLLCL